MSYKGFELIESKDSKEVVAKKGDKYLTTFASMWAAKYAIDLGYLICR